MKMVISKNISRRLIECFCFFRHSIPLFPGITSSDISALRYHRLVHQLAGLAWCIPQPVCPVSVLPAGFNQRLPGYPNIPAGMLDAGLG
jgi:hypothetical protein